MRRRPLIMASLCFLSTQLKMACSSSVATGAVEAARIDRISRFFRGNVDGQLLPGAVVMIARSGSVSSQEGFGFRNPGTQAGMRIDSIFRIYSMTKPVTAVAVLMLMEEGKIRLDDAVSIYLPAFKHPKVLIERVDEVGGRSAITVPAIREISIRDLLTHTSGITYGVGPSLAAQLMKDAGIASELGSAGVPLSSRIDDTRLVAKIAQLPLMFQPGTAWHYGRSSDVLLALVEAVSGMRADEFYEQKIFRPLGMTDTFFNVPADKRDRVAQPGRDPYSIFGNVPRLTDVSQTRTFLAGGAGLLSTAPDYMRFALMLANKGELGGVRILSPQTVDLMTSDQIGPELSKAPEFNSGDGCSYGFGVTVRTATSATVPGKIGEFGAGGTLFWVDPEERLVVVLMTQSPSWVEHNGPAFRSLVYQVGLDYQIQPVPRGRSVHSMIWTVTVAAVLFGLTGLGSMFLRFGHRRKHATSRGEPADRR